jgi:hypothetical protein
MAEIQRQAESMDHQRRQLVEEQGRVELSVEEIHKRTEELGRELEMLKKQPVAKKVLRYQTPVARSVQSDELHFEIQHGRVAFLDVEALTREIKQEMRSKVDTLKQRWEVQDETGPIGPFKMRYVISRQRSLIESATGAGTPDSHTGFSYGLDGWEVVPVVQTRGEVLEKALEENSDFRQLIDRVDATHAAVTFWVYPDSFPAYRALRDYCLKHDLLVSGRPLTEGMPIAGSRHGSISRGQ